MDDVVGSVAIVRSTSSCWWSLRDSGAKTGPFCSVKSKEPRIRRGPSDGAGDGLSKASDAGLDGERASQASPGVGDGWMDEAKGGVGKIAEEQGRSGGIDKAMPIHPPTAARGGCRLH